jgi:hypothetical protein
MGSKASPPPAPNLAKDYAAGIQAQLKYLPKQLRAEYKYRSLYDPKYIEQQQAEREQYLPTQIGQQLAALQQIDPTGVAIRNQLAGTVGQYLQQGYLNPQQAAAYSALGKSVTGGLTAGTRQTPQQLAEDIATIRAGQAARGNITGNAPATAEAMYAGQKGQQLLAQRQQAGTQFAQLQTPQAQALAAGYGFMGARSPIADIMGIQDISVPSASRYVNPLAGQQGAQYGLQNYQNQLGYNQLTQNNPWMGALSGAASGAAAGTTISPGYGTAIGAVAGGLGGYFSDERLKENITRAGLVTKDGIPIVEFNFKGLPKPRFRGVLAQDVQKIRPDAVRDLWGLLAVDYAAIGTTMEVI